MVIFFLTKQYDVCLRIAEMLKHFSCICSVFTSPEEFYTSIREHKKGEINLLAIDYRSFEHDFFDPYKFLIKYDCVIPLIFYNDPYPEPEERAVFWKVQNHDHFKAHLSGEILDDLEETFLYIQMIVNSPELNKYISLINKPIPFYSSEDENVIKEFNIEEYKRRLKIPESRYKLLLYFYNNMDKSLSQKNICQYLWKDASDKKIQTLYVYIHDLRKKFVTDEKVKLSILHTDKNNYKLEIKNNPESNGTSENAIAILNKVMYEKINFKTVSEEYINKYQKNNYCNSEE